jgi:serine phosphatase RsbU (regulator of sigma subunit)
MAATTINGSSRPLVSEPEVGALTDAAPAVLLAWDGKAECVEVRAGLGDEGEHDEMLGLLVGDRWLELVHPDDRERAHALVRSVLERTTSAEDGVRLSHRDRWAVLRVHRRQKAGATGATGVLVDASKSFGSTARLARLVENLNQLRREDDIVRAVLSEGVGLLGGHSATVHVLDETGSELIMVGSVGVPPDQIVEVYGRIPADAPLPGIDAMRTGEPVVVRSLAERRQRYPIMDKAKLEWDPAFVVVPMYRATGEAFGVLGVGFPSEQALDDLDDRFLAEVASQSALALDRAQLARVAERNQEQLAFLDALSGALSRSLDVGTALTGLAELTVPRLADWCAVRVVESAAIPSPMVGVAHRDPTKVDLLIELAERLPRDLAARADLGEAFRSSRPFVSEGRDPHDVARQLGDTRIADALELIGSRVLVIFPLYARGRLIGALGFGNGANREMRHDEFELAHAVAVRAAVLVDNSRLFAERSEVARALQDSLLPGVLPEIPGLELGARYRPAGHGLDVGGDFYDAFQADANWWVFAVGDVCGHGVEAASLTGLARHTIRSAAMGGVMPSAVLGHLNRMLLQHTAEQAARYEGDVPMTPRFCTVLVGAVQPTAEGVDIIVCSAGHPLPLVRRATDAVEPVGVPGTLLGITDDVNLTDTVVHLSPEESLVCYTDGLTDRRSGRRVFGEEGVVTAIMHGRNQPAPAMAQRIEADAVGFVDTEPTDDMAVLVLRALHTRPATVGDVEGASEQADRAGEAAGGDRQHLQLR